MRTSPATDPLESRIQAIGRELFDRVQGEGQAAFRGDRWTAGLIEWALQHEDAKPRAAGRSRAEQACPS